MPSLIALVSIISSVLTFPSGLVNASPLAVKRGVIAYPVPRTKYSLLVMNDCNYAGLTYSAITFYANWAAKGAGGQLPDNVVDFGKKVTWEGSTFTGTYADDGATVSVSIVSNGASLERRDYAGTGQESNGTWTQQYTCVKDNGHKVFAITGGETCYSQYFCNPN